MIDETKYPRILKHEYLHFRLPYEKDEWSFADIQRHANQVMADYGKKAEELEIDVHYSYDDPKELEIRFERFENDAEYEDRVKRQIAYEQKKEADRRRKKKSQEEKDLAKLAELRKKYPDA